MFYRSLDSGIERQNKEEIFKKTISIIKQDDLSSFIEDPVFQNTKEKTVVFANLENIYSYLSSTNIGFIHVAAFYDAINIFTYLVEEIGVDILQTNVNNYNTLHYACLTNSIKVASYILAKRPETPIIVTQTEYQYIYYAAVGKSTTILELLIKCGADINSQENRIGDPIKIALASRQIELLKILVKHYKRGDTEQTMTPLMYAINYSFNEAAQFLIESGCIVDEIVSGQKALTLACRAAYQDVNLIRMLCDFSHEVDMPSDFKGQSAIHWICLTSNPEIVRTVLEYNIDVNRADDKGCYGPELLSEYKTKENLEILDLLYQHGYDPCNVNPITKIPSYVVFLQHIRIPIEIIAWFIKHGVKIDTDPYNKNLTVRNRILRMPKIIKGLKNFGIYIEK